MSIKSIKFYGGSSKGGKASGGKAKGGKAKATKPAKVSSKRK